MTQKIRVLEIGAEYLDNCDISCMNVFNEVSRIPPDARALKQSVVFRFMKYSNTNIFWSVPEIRAFINCLDEKYPFFLYFLWPEKKFNLLQHYLQCLLPGKTINTSGGWGMEILPIDLFELLRRKIGTLIDYCQLVASDPHETVRSIIYSAPNPQNVLAPLYELADNPIELRTMLMELLPPPSKTDAWESIKNDLRYWSFKKAMDDDPFVGSKDSEVHLDFAVIRQLVYKDPESAKRWFNEFLETAQSMPNASFAKIMVIILFTVAGFLEEQGNPQPMQLLEMRYGKFR